MLAPLVTDSQNKNPATNSNPVAVTTTPSPPYTPIAATFAETSTSTSTPPYVPAIRYTPPAPSPPDVSHVDIAVLPSSDPTSSPHSSSDSSSIRTSPSVSSSLHLTSANTTAMDESSSSCTQDLSSQSAPPVLPDTKQLRQRSIRLRREKAALTTRLRMVSSCLASQRAMIDTVKSHYEAKLDSLNREIMLLQESAKRNSQFMKRKLFESDGTTSFASFIRRQSARGGVKRKVVMSSEWLCSNSNRDGYYSGGSGLSDDESNDVLSMLTEQAATEASLLTNILDYISDVCDGVIQSEEGRKALENVRDKVEEGRALIIDVSISFSFLFFFSLVVFFFFFFDRL